MEKHDGHNPDSPDGWQVGNAQKRSGSFGGASTFAAPRPVLHLKTTNHPRCADPAQCPLGAGTQAVLAKEGIGITA